MTIDERIDESRRRRDERRAEVERRRTEERTQRETRLAEIMDDLERRLGDAVPEPLRPFVTCLVPEVSEELLKLYPDQWTPCDFRIDEPDRLAPIRFTTTTDGPNEPLRVTLIQVGQDKFGVDWDSAIAAAADLHDQPQQETKDALAHTQQTPQS